MIEQVQTPLLTAATSSMGILAQAVIPLPDDLRSWPVTAMLVLIVLACLGIIAYQVWASSNALVKAATALTAITDAIGASEKRNETLSENVKVLVAELRARPCIRG